MRKSLDNVHRMLMRETKKEEGRKRKMNYFMGPTRNLGARRCCAI
jgi:hypothetical protein